MWAMGSIGWTGVYRLNWRSLESARSLPATNQIQRFVVEINIAEAHIAAMRHGSISMTNNITFFSSDFWDSLSSRFFKIEMVRWSFCDFPTRSLALSDLWEDANAPERRHGLLSKKYGDFKAFFVYSDSDFVSETSFACVARRHWVFIIWDKTLRGEIFCCTVILSTLVRQKIILTKIICH